MFGKVDWDKDGFDGAHLHVVKLFLGSVNRFSLFVRVAPFFVVDSLGQRGPVSALQPWLSDQA